MKWLIAIGVAIGLCLGASNFGLSSESPCRRFWVENRVHVALVFRADGHAGEISWLDTVSGRSGNSPFETADECLLHVQMPGGWCAEARFLSNVALLLNPPPWNPEANQVALGLSLD